MKFLLEGAIMMQCTFSEPWGDGVSYRQCTRDAVCLGRCREHANPIALESLAAMEYTYRFLEACDHEQSYIDPKTGLASKIRLRQAIARMRGLT